MEGYAQVCISACAGNDRYSQKSETLKLGESGTFARLRSGCRVERARQLRRRLAVVLQLAVLRRAAFSEYDSIPAARDVLCLPRTGRRTVGRRRQVPSRLRVRQCGACQALGPGSSSLLATRTHGPVSLAHRGSPITSQGRAIPVLGTSRWSGRRIQVRMTGFKAAGTLGRTTGSPTSHSS